MNDASIIVRADHLCVVRNQSTLISDLSFSLRAGDVMALLGANGAGKSTLIAALANELPLTSGTLAINDKPLHTYDAETLAEVRALNAVEPPLAFSLSVFDYVALGRPFVEPDCEGVLTALEQSHATQWMNRDAASLSSGELLRVQLARSLYQLGDTPNAIWLLDEPLAHLDLAQRQFALQLMRNVATARRWAIVFSTHDPRDASSIGDQALLLCGGKPVAIGPPGITLTADVLNKCYGVEVSLAR